MADRYNTANLSSLADMTDYEVEDGEPDPRGWEVLGADGRRVGEVDDMLIDEAALKVRYLDVDIDERGIGLDAADRHVLVPVEAARVDEDRECVVVDRLSVASLRNVRGRTEWGALDRAGNRDEARVTRAEEELAVGKRSVRAGSVEVEKHVETERVREPVRLTHDEVEIERRPVSGQQATSGNAAFRDQEIRVPLTEEEAVVSKRPVVREEIVLRKRQVADTDMVEADLRKEKVDINKRGRVEAEETRRRTR